MHEKIKNKNGKDEMTMKDFIKKLVKDFNEYSILVAVGRAREKEGKSSEFLEWNRGSLNRIEDYLKQLIESTSEADLKWGVNECVFGTDDCERKLKYRTVRVVFEN